jgi:2Fe-2S ferredoxin
LDLRVTDIHVTKRDGSEHVVTAQPGRSLMETLRDGGMQVDGICGGGCNCGTCHVYVADEWLARLTAKAEDEQAMLDGIGELVEVRPNSRLACQIAIEEELTGLRVQVGPVP